MSQSTGAKYSDADGDDSAGIGEDEGVSSGEFPCTVTGRSECNFEVDQAVRIIGICAISV